jgi:hypothetical protein
MDKKLAAPMKPFGNLILMTVICIVIFWVFMALRPAHAVDQLYPMTSTQIEYLPPKEFDHEYREGLVRINRGTQRCPILKSGPIPSLGCAGRILHQETNLEACTIWIANDDLLRERGVNFETVLRHEIGHCNGWHHDKND